MSTTLLFAVVTWLAGGGPHTAESSMPVVGQPRHTSLMQARPGITCLVDRAGKLMASNPTAPIYSHVRSTEQFMIDLVREGYRRSETFLRLVDALEQSNVIVIVKPGFCAGGRIRSCLVSVDGSLHDRHIRIKVDPHANHNRLIATVAHELQHAVEIAEHLEVTDGAGALALYRQIAIGRCREGLSEECETTRALEMEQKVLEELSRRGAITPVADESLAIQVATSDVDTGTTLYKLRTTDKLASVAIQEGRQRSATFASLVEIVERSDTFVYVVSVHKLPHDMVGCLVHEGQGSGVRYLKVLVLMGMRSERMIVVLAHELQHVREVLDAGISNSQSAMGELFSRIGVPQLGTVTGEQFETKSAHEVMALVARELRTHRRVRQP